MNLLRIALATLAAFVAYFAVGSVFFTIRAMRAEFAKYPAVYRSGDMMKSRVMGIGMFGILLAIAAAAAIFARIHPVRVSRSNSAPRRALMRWRHEHVIMVRS